MRRGTQVDREQRRWARFSCDHSWQEMKLFHLCLCHHLLSLNVLHRGAGLAGPPRVLRLLLLVGAMRRTCSTLIIAERGTGSCRGSERMTSWCHTAASVAPPSWSWSQHGNAAPEWSSWRCCRDSCCLCSALHGSHPPLKPRRANFLFGKISPAPRNQNVNSADLPLMRVVLLRREGIAFDQCARPFIWNADYFKFISKIGWYAITWGHLIRFSVSVAHKTPAKSVVLFLCSCDPCCWKVEQHVWILFFILRRLFRVQWVCTIFKVAQ